MPANPPPAAIVIVLDVGKSVSTLHEYEKETFFKLARDCVSWIIQRKIISQSPDNLSLLLIGSNESDNPKASGYENLCVKFDFQLASWDMLKFMETEVETTDKESDWFGALIVSTEMLKAYEEYNTVSSKKIVILSDFTKPAADDLNSIAKTLKALDIEVTIIGPDHLHFLTESDDTDEPKGKKMRLEKNQERQEGERIVHELWKRLPENVWICTFESALKQLCSYAPKPKRPFYWHCVMDIGDVNINISAVKKTDQKPTKKFNIKCLKPTEEEIGQSTSQDSMVKSENTTPAVRDSVMRYKHETGQNSEFVDVEVKPEDTIEGFRYGTTVIPFSAEDKIAMEYKSGPKAFSVIGFTPIARVPYYLLSGECSYLVVPREKDKNAELALSALIQGMKRLEHLAIVRRVYNDNWGLSLGILYPIIEEIFSDESDDVSFKEYLLFIELAFADDVKSISFPSLEKVANNITQEQYDAIDNLIDGMNLMKADKGLRGEPCEAFDLPYLHDVKEQFFHYCVIQRGLYPDKPLPSSLPSYLHNFTKVPKSIKETRESVVKDIKNQFKIKKVEVSNEFKWKRGKSAKDTSGDKDEGGKSEKKVEHFSESFINEDTNSFNRSWLRLFAKGFPTNDELDKVFVTFDDMSELEKSEVLKSFSIVLTRVHAMYMKCIPNEYNRWIKGFKKYLQGKHGIESKIWEIIVSEYVGLITKKENKYSNIPEEEAEVFLCVDIVKPNSPKKMPDFELLDELQAEQMNMDFE